MALMTTPGMELPTYPDQPISRIPLSLFALAVIESRALEAYDTVHPDDELIKRASTTVRHRLDIASILGTTYLDSEHWETSFAASNYEDPPTLAILMRADLLGHAPLSGEQTRLCLKEIIDQREQMRAIQKRGAKAFPDYAADELLVVGAALHHRVASAPNPILQLEASLALVAHGIK